MDQAQISQQPSISEQENVNSSFGESSFSRSGNGMKEKFQQIVQAVRYYAMQIWPYFRQLINFIIYQTIKVLKAIVRIGLSQTGIIKD